MLEQLDTVIGFATVMLLLSLLVTTIVQMVLAVFSLRGKCLLEGTEQLLKQLYPNLNAEAGDQARKIAEKILRHPAIGVKTSAGRGFLPEKVRMKLKNLRPKLAVAIRSEELILVLKDLAERGEGIDQRIKDRLMAAFTDTPGQSSAEMIAKTEELLKKMESRFPEETKNLRDAVESVLGTTQSIAVRVDAWFDTVMDRTSEMFKIYTRRITGIVAVVFALLLHVDSLAILRQISQDEDLRANLVQMSGEVVAEGEKVLAPEGSLLATKALREVAQDKTRPEVAQAISALCTGEVKTCFANLSTRREGWSVLQSIPEAQKAEALKAYEEAYTKAAKARLSSLGVSFNTLQDYLTDTQLEVIPDPVPWPWEFKGGRNFLGIVMTAFFLSLGAPFWYNTLRKLSDLRPIVARRVDGEPLKGAPKKES